METRIKNKEASPINLSVKARIFVFFIAAFLAITTITLTRHTRDRSTKHLAETQSYTMANISNLNGAYLAARNALANKNYERAEDLFLVTLGMVSDGDASEIKLAHQTMRVMLRNGNIEGALKLIDKYSLQASSDAARLAAIAQKVKINKLEDAIFENNKLSEAGIGPYASPLINSWLLADIGGYTKAIESLTSIDPENKTLDTLAAYHSALISEATGKNADTESYYIKALGDDEVKAQRITENYGAFLERSGHLETAKKLYLEFEESSNGNWFGKVARAKANSGHVTEKSIKSPVEGVAEVFFNLASLAFDVEESEDAYILLNIALYLNPNLDNAKLMKGLFLEADGNCKEAINAYSTLSSTSIYNVKAMQQTASCHKNAGNIKGALNVLDKIYESNKHFYDALVQKGDILRANERFDEAEIEYSKAINIASSDLKAHNWKIFYYRGMCLERMDKWEEAERDLNASLKLNPEQPDAMNYLAYSWVERGQNIELAVSYLERAYTQKPYEAHIADSFGWALYSSGKYDEAVEVLETALKIKPDDPFINDHLGDAYWKIGRTIEAKYQWNKALKFNPSNELAKSLDGKISNGLAHNENINIIQQSKVEEK